jgi:GTP-binding protein
MFIDETVITVRAGDGGNGCYAFERQKYRPLGRPSGGSGGRGGHVVVKGTAQVHTLQDVSYRRSYKAKRGVHGQGSTKDGRSGENVVIPVPLGTIVTDNETGQILFDCIGDGVEHIVAQGGAGGRGNARLTTRKNPRPECAQPGKGGQVRHLKLTLKVLADVGLVGRPNAGKSTFLARVSKARPKIADYPFTTTEPHLGIVSYPDSHDTLVFADIPGLIEDSHQGKGLGIRFLKHIERTQVLAVLVESLSEAPEEDATVLLDELRQYSPALADKPHRFILTKADLCATHPPPDLPSGWLWMSSVSGEGVGEVLRTLREMYDTLHEE